MIISFNMCPYLWRRKYIERCAVSLFEQTYQNIEYIFVNDCTKDNSIDILRQTMERYPNRVSQVHIIEHKHNTGLAGARNTAVKSATGDFIMHVDSDDYVSVDIVSRSVAKQKSLMQTLLLLTLSANIQLINKYSNIQTLRKVNYIA